MSDIIVRLGGRQKQVERAFRESPDVPYLREFAELLRVDANGVVVETIGRVTPGSWVYGVSDILNDQPYSAYKKRLDCLPVFFVLEIVQKGATITRLESGSDDGDVLVMACKPVGEVRGSRLRSKARLNETDLVMGDQPYYMSIDAIASTMQVVIGPGDATPGFDGPRRVSHYATNVNEDVEVGDDGVSEINALYPNSDILRPTLEHAADFFALQNAGAAGAAGATGRKRSLSMSSKPDTPAAAATTTAAAPTRRRRVPTGRPRGRPRKIEAPPADDDDDDDSVDVADDAEDAEDAENGVGGGDDDDNQEADAPAARALMVLSGAKSAPKSASAARADADDDAPVEVLSAPSALYTTSQPLRSQNSLGEAAPASAPASLGASAPAPADASAPRAPATAPASSGAAPATSSGPGSFGAPSPSSLGAAAVRPTRISMSSSSPRQFSGVPAPSSSSPDALSSSPPVAPPGAPAASSSPPDAPSAAAPFGAPVSSSQSSGNASALDMRWVVDAASSISAAGFPSNYPQTHIRMLLQIEQTMCHVAYDCDLTQNTWQAHKPRLTDYILKLLQTNSYQEAVFVISMRARSAFATFSAAHLGGEFGAFIDSVLRQHREETTKFLSKWSRTILPVVHNAYVRPMVYRHLQEIEATFGLEPFDADIVAAALRLREANVGAFASASLSLK